MGLDEYETRSWAGWHHHIACVLGGAFLLSITRPQVYRVVREINCCCGWRIRSYATNPTRDAAELKAESGTACLIE